MPEDYREDAPRAFARIAAPALSRLSTFPGQGVKAGKPSHPAHPARRRRRAMIGQPIRGASFHSIFDGNIFDANAVDGEK